MSLKRLTAGAKDSLLWREKNWVRPTFYKKQILFIPWLMSSLWLRMIQKVLLCPWLSAAGTGTLWNAESCLKKSLLLSQHDLRFTFLHDNDPTTHQNKFPYVDRRCKSNLTELERTCKDEWECLSMKKYQVLKVGTKCLVTLWCWDQTTQYVLPSEVATVSD